MKAYTDLKTIASRDDPQHKVLTRLPDFYYTWKDFYVHVHYDTDGTPLTALGIIYEPTPKLLKNPTVCPIDPTADLQFKFWTADLRQPTAKLEHGYAQNCLYAFDLMGTLNSGKAWGAVPSYSTHLLTWLDKMNKAKAVEKVTFDNVKTLFSDIDAPIDLQNHTLYIADRLKAETWLRGQ